MADAVQYPVLDIASLSPPLNIVLVQDGAGLAELKKWADRKPEVFGLDLETNVVQDWVPRRVRTAQVGDRDVQFVIDFLAFAETAEKLVSTQGFYGQNNGEVYKPIFDILEPLICSNAAVKVGQFLQFEYETLRWNFGKRIWHLYSIDLVERAIQAGAISLKKYDEYSLEAIFRRYFRKQISKELQVSFDLSSALTTAQLEYAALDIRLPLAVRLMQMRTLSSAQLATIAQIENDSLVAFSDIFLNGQRLDTEKWLKRLDNLKAQRVEALKILDRGFIPLVGRKDSQIDEEELSRREKIWREGFEEATAEEKELAAKKRLEKDKIKKSVLGVELKALENKRKVKKADARKQYSELSKKRTDVVKNLERCEGEAYINYSSNDQLISALNKIKGIKLESAADDALLIYNDNPLIQELRKYRLNSKQLSTYGESWCRKWQDHPCKEQGFLHPWDGRLHCQWNQYEAETGRTSSSKPNGQNLPLIEEIRSCFIAREADEDAPEGYVIATIDLEGCELRIIADLSEAKSWIDAFNSGADIHSVSTEILWPDKWPSLALASCAYYALVDGKPKHAKCECPGHIELRQQTKEINFLIAYGGGPPALADALGISIENAKVLMQKHEAAFPDVWKFLEQAGREAREQGEARDMFGRRRILPHPSQKKAEDWFKSEREEKLRLPDEVVKQNLFSFKAKNLREPRKEELWQLSHRPINKSDINYAVRALMGGLERQGRNMPAQGTNCSIVKLALSCGFDRDGVPYLWHTLPKYKARVLSMVHDELQIEYPKRFGNIPAELAKDAFKRAAAQVMHKVVMESSYKIGDCWKK